MYYVCVDVMQHIDCHDSAAVATDNADVTVSVLSITDDGQVTVNVNVYVSLQYPPVVFMHSPDDFVLQFVTQLFNMLKRMSLSKLSDFAVGGHLQN